MSRALAEVERKVQHVGVHMHHITCLQTNYADDMHAVVHDVADTQAYMDCLVSCLAPLNQHLSVPKCQITVPISRVSDTPNTPVIHNMKVVEQMTILGLIYRHDGSLTSNIQHRTSKAKSQCGIVFQKLRETGCQHDVRIAKLLHGVNVGQTLLHGSQMWGYSKLKSASPMKHEMQPAYSVIPRHVLRQNACTAHWIVCMHMGLMPIQYWIMRSFVRWWNKLLSIRGQNTVHYRQLPWSPDWHVEWP